MKHFRCRSRLRWGIATLVALLIFSRGAEGQVLAEAKGRLNEAVAPSASDRASLFSPTRIHLWSEPVVAAPREPTLELHLREQEDDRSRSAWQWVGAFAIAGAIGGAVYCSDPSPDIAPYCAETAEASAVGWGLGWGGAAFMFFWLIGDIELGSKAWFGVTRSSLVQGLGMSITP